MPCFCLPDKCLYICLYEFDFKACIKKKFQINQSSHTLLVTNFTDRGIKSIGYISIFVVKRKMCIIMLLPSPNHFLINDSYHFVACAVDALAGRGQMAVANNISNRTHRLQWWDISDNVLPDISDGMVKLPNLKLLFPNISFH